MGHRLGGQEQEPQLFRERSRRMGGHLLLQLAREDGHDFRAVLLADRVAEIHRHDRLL